MKLLLFTTQALVEKRPSEVIVHTMNQSNLTLSLSGGSLSVVPYPSNPGPVVDEYQLDQCDLLVLEEGPAGTSTHILGTLDIEMSVASESKNGESTIEGAAFQPLSTLKDEEDLMVLERSGGEIKVKVLKAQQVPA